MIPSGWNHGKRKSVTRYFASARATKERKRDIQIVVTWMVIDQEPPQKRRFTVMALTHDQAYRRYICDQCLWSVDVFEKDTGEGKAAFDAHDCNEYRRRDSLT